MRFSDFEPGRVFKAGPVSLTESEIVDFARQFDPQPFHVDPERAKAGHWGGIIASGWHTTGIAMRLFCEGVVNGSETIGSPGIDFIRFVAPVRPGDAIRLEATVLERRLSASKPNLGIVKWRWQVFNQRDEEVYRSESTGLFEIG